MKWARAGRDTKASTASKPATERRIAGRALDTPQVRVDQMAILQALDGFETVVARAHPLVLAQVMPGVRGVELLDALAQRPLRRIPRQLGLDLREVNTVVAGVGRRAGRVADLRVRDHRRHGLGDLADAEVLALAPDVESLVVNRVLRRRQAADEGVDDVADVDQRAPGRAVA